MNQDNTGFVMSYIKSAEQASQELWYKLSSYKNGEKLPSIISFNELDLELNMLESTYPTKEFQKILIFIISNKPYMKENYMNHFLEKITMSELDVGIRFRHPILHEISHQVFSSTSPDLFVKFFSNPSLSKDIDNPNYIDGYGMMIKQRLSSELGGYNIKKDPKLSDGSSLIKWINDNLNVKAFEKKTHNNRGYLVHPQPEDYTFE